MALRNQVGEQAQRRWRPVRRAVLSRRRPLAALLAAAAVVAALHQVRPPAPEVQVVLAAARDLPAGTRLTGRDLRRIELARGTAPAGLATHPVGRTLASPVRAGEPVTDVRLVGPALAAAYPGDAVMPVRLPDAGMAGLLSVGDVIDLVAADPQGTDAVLVAGDVRVVALPETDDEVVAGGLPGRLVLVAVPHTDVAGLAQAAVTGFLTFTLSG
jgi:Flp pilus assembly protein CpaB